MNPTQAPKWSKTKRATGSCLIVAGIAALVLRFLAVRWGILYGSSAVAQVDAIVAALVAIGVALIAWGWKRHTDTQPDTEQKTTPAQRWTDWVSVITALVGAGTLVISLMNLVEPLNPSRLAKFACPGARDNNVPYVGITASVDGVNTRQGPGESYEADGRFPDSCSVGFSAYCLGDSIVDATGSTQDETWVTSRWLMVAKQPPGFRSRAASVLSGESSEPQFISDALVTPETAYDRLPEGTRCPPGFPNPKRVVLQPFNADAGTFTAHADYAANIGFAVWVPRDAGFLNGDSYIQITVPGGGAANNPGEASPTGVKKVEWDYAGTLLPKLQGSGAHGSRAGEVTVLAVPCLADNIPAQSSAAAIAGYRLSRGAPPVPVSRYPAGFNKDRLARAACEAAT